MKTLKFDYNLQIIVDAEELKNKYPNYKINFRNTDEFVSFLISSLKSAGNISKNNLNEFGYSIQISEKK